jgi:hypothetical protein
MARGKPAANLIFGIDPRQQHDAIDMLPSLTELRLQGEFVAHADEAHHLVRGVLFKIGRQLERRGRRQIAKADVGEIRPFRQTYSQDHMEHRSGRVDRKPTHHPRLQARDIEAERAQAGAEQKVLLEAIATAAVRNHFSLQRIEVKLWRPVEQHVDALIGDRRGMRSDQTAQCRQRRCARSFVSDAGQPGVLIETGLGHAPLTRRRSR